MRDLLSLVLPGSIVIMSLLLLFIEFDQLYRYVKEIHFLLYIPIFGFCFLMGFFVQCFGTLISNKRPIIKMYKPRWLNTNENVGGDKGNEVTMPSKIVCAKRNIETLKLQGRYKQHWERIVVLKQMCGNNAMALLISMIIYMNKIYYKEVRIPTIREWLLILTYFFVVYYLFRGHEEQVDRQMAFENEVLDKKEYMEE